MPPDQMQTVTGETDFSQFLGSNRVSLMRTKGFSKGEGFFEWMDEKLEGRMFEDMERDF